LVPRRLFVFGRFIVALRKRNNVAPVAPVGLMSDRANSSTRPAIKTKSNSQKHPAKTTCKNDLQKRPAKITCKNNLQK
jgi:hypothetical protein